MPNINQLIRRLRKKTIAPRQTYGRRSAAILRYLILINGVVSKRESVPADHLEHSDHGNGEGVNTPSSANPTSFGAEARGIHIASRRYRSGGKSIRLRSRSRLRARHTRKPVVGIIGPHTQGALK
jgi:hypothetical protein